MDVKDIASSASASIADAFSSMTSIKFGDKIINYGGSQSVEKTTRDSQDASTAPVADAVASTAKAGDGGVAESSASMLKNAAAAAGLDLRTAGIAAAATAAGLLLLGGAVLGVRALFSRRKKGGR
jgi:hypothetical protein